MYLQSSQVPMRQDWVRQVTVPPSESRYLHFSLGLPNDSTSDLMLFVGAHLIELSISRVQVWNASDELRGTADHATRECDHLLNNPIL
jgi:hypothetical protein